MIRFDKLLILDIDETLIYSSETPLDTAPDFRLSQYFVYKRPGLDQFLATVSTWFHVAIWTSATQDYAEEVIKQVFPQNLDLLFVFTRANCVRTVDLEKGLNEILYIKPLKKVKKFGYALEQVIILDDESVSFHRNYGNAIRITKYEGGRADDELHWLLRYLEMLGQAADVRPLEKRNWRLQVQGEAP